MQPNFNSIQAFERQSCRCCAIVACNSGCLAKCWTRGGYRFIPWYGAHWIQLFIHSFVHSFVRSFIRSFLHSFTLFGTGNLILHPICMLHPWILVQVDVSEKTRDLESFQETDQGCWAFSDSDDWLLLCGVTKEHQRTKCQKKFWTTRSNRGYPGYTSEIEVCSYLFGVKQLFLHVIAHLCRHFSTSLSCLILDERSL